MRFLVDRGADARACDSGAARRAPARGHLAVVQYLVTRGADIRARGDECVRNASAGGHLAVMRFLFERGADIRARNNKCVRAAMFGGHLKVMLYLASLGADPLGNGGIQGSAHAPNDATLRYLVAIGGDIIWFAYMHGVPLSTPMVQRNLSYLTRRIRLLVRLRSRAARRAYFWWVPLCFDRGRRAGRRAARRNLAAFRRLAA